MEENNLFEETAEDDDDLDVNLEESVALNPGDGHSGRSPSNAVRNESDELENFRKQWKCEISQNTANNVVAVEAASTHSQSIEIVRSIAELESKKIFQIGDYDDDNDSSKSEDDYDEEDEGEDELITDLENLQIRKNINQICIPEFSQQGTHISALPLEILTYIFKWVVSSNIDVDSLERLALVCRSFYFISRSEDMWKLICMRTWEKSIVLSTYPSFREMFIERPRVKFNGCYISKSTYFRNGEKSFDGLYKPLHIVDYFRYIRFYPEGKVYMLNSPDQPLNVLPFLKTRNTYVQGLQYGHYKLTNDKLSLVLKKKPDPSNKMKRFIRNSQYYTDYEQTFCLDFTLKTVGKRRHCQLLWNKYTLHSCNKSTGELTTVTFELTSSKYPPLYFSTVRSFMAYSDCPL